MDENIKFKALTKDTNVWVYGYYFWSELEDKHYIIGESKDYGFQKIEILKDSLAQFLGFYDVKNKEVYDGDLVRCKENSFGREITTIHTVDITDFTLMLALEKQYYSIEVIGSIYNNLIK